MCNCTLRARSDGHRDPSSVLSQFLLHVHPGLGQGVAALGTVVPCEWGGWGTTKRLRGRGFVLGRRFEGQHGKEIVLGEGIWGGGGC